MFDYLNDLLRRNNPMQEGAPQAAPGFEIGDGMGVDTGLIPLAKQPVSQFTGIGDALKGGAAGIGSAAGKIGHVMNQENMPGVLSNLAKMVLAGGGVQGMPINAVANATNQMANQTLAGKLMNKAYTLPPSRSAVPVAPAPAPVAPVASAPATRMGSLDQSVFAGRKKDENTLDNPFWQTMGGR